MPDKLFNHLFNNNYTKSDLLQKVRLLRSEVEKGLSSDLIPANLYKDLKKEDLYSKIEEYTKTIGKLPELTLVLPFSPEEADLAHLATWLRKEVKPELLLSLQLDPSLGAGCGLIIDGTYHDYSLNAELKQINSKIQTLLANFEKRVLEVNKITTDEKQN